MLLHLILGSAALLAACFTVGLLLVDHRHPPRRPRQAADRPARRPAARRSPAGC